MWEKRNACRILVGKPEGERPLGRLRRRWECSIKMDLREKKGCGGIDWIMAQDCVEWQALVNTVMNLRVPKNVGKFLSSWAVGGLSRAQLHAVIWFVYLFCCLFIAIWQRCQKLTIIASKYEGYAETSGELLTKQAVRKKTIIYKKNAYILKLLLNVVTDGIEAFVISGNNFLYACAKEVCPPWAEPCFDTFHQLPIIIEHCDLNQFFTYVNRW
jgi:hypothetical protein